MQEGEGVEVIPFLEKFPCLLKQSVSIDIYAPQPLNWLFILPLESCANVITCRQPGNRGTRQNVRKPMQILENESTGSKNPTYWFSLGFVTLQFILLIK